MLSVSERGRSSVIITDGKLYFVPIYLFPTFCNSIFTDIVELGTRYREVGYEEQSNSIPWKVQHQDRMIDEYSMVYLIGVQ